MPAERSVNLPLLSIVAEGFLSRLSFGVISFALPLYAHHLGLSLTEIGLLAALNTIVAIVLKPITGWAADRLGLKRIFVTSISVRSLVALLLSFTGVPWQLYAIRTAHGLATSLRDPSSSALIAEHGGKKAVASAFAWYQTAKSVAGSLGKAVAGFLLALTAANYSLVFFAAFLLSVLPLIVVVRFVPEATRAAEPVSKTAATVSAPSPIQRAQASRGILGRLRAVAPYIGFGFLISTTAEMMTSLFPILATEYAGLSEAQAGIIFALSTLATLVAGPVFGWLADNVSNKLVLMVRSIANTLSSLLYLVSPGFAGVAVGKVADDIGKTAFRPAWGALMTHVSSFDKQRRAQTMSLMTLGEDTGDIVGPILAGFLWSTWGVAFVFVVRAVLAVATEVYAVTLTGSLEKRKSRDSVSDIGSRLSPPPPIDWCTHCRLRDWRLEIRDWRLEIRDWRLEAGDSSEHSPLFRY